MPMRIVEKQLVCSECGRPLRRERVAIQEAEQILPPPEDDFEDEIDEDDGNVSIDSVIERGPVCRYCAEHR